jgi:phosphoesterase RecJ-like protein
VDAVLLFKRQGAADVFRVSLRSKGPVDVRAVAASYGGGGHFNAAGCTVTGAYDALKQAMVAATVQHLALAEA